MYASVNAWDLALWVVAAYVAVVSLVRLMAYERDHLILRFRAQVERKRRRNAQSALRQKRDETHAASVRRRGAAG
jgi:hypothetical protein